jgi:hypothetical protein
LLAENEREAKRRLLFRNYLEEEEMLLMHRPISTEKAFALFGMLLGMLPPAAIFLKILPSTLASGLFVLFLIMNLVCCFVGRWMGAWAGRWLGSKGNASWAWTVFASLVAGVVWGVVTGGAGGLPAFGIGAIFGAVCAMIVAIVAFPLFALLHRPLTCGGMIEARHLWPLACGVVTLISALILGM